MKLSNLYKQIIGEGFSLEANPNCDCCEYFDFTFSQAGGYFAGLKHPIYYAISKSEVNQLTYITPKQYIYNIARGFGNLSYEDVVESGAVSKAKVKEYAQNMKKGEKFPIGWYDDRGGQEGRHRALAAMSLGCKSIPVIYISHLTYDEKLNLAKSYKGLSREELNQIYVDKGYNGITDLDWNDLQRFIDYNVK